ASEATTYITDALQIKEETRNRGQRKYSLAQGTRHGKRSTDQNCSHSLSEQELKCSAPLAQLYLESCSVMQKNWFVLCLVGCHLGGGYETQSLDLAHLGSEWHEDGSYDASDLISELHIRIPTTTVIGGTRSPLKQDTRQFSVHSQSER
ncbi:hypothetical protein STEG23_013457, partial [Scotinomys teguina]